MGFMRPKAPEPTPVPTADPASAQLATDEFKVDEKLNVKKQKKAGKSDLTVTPITTTSGLNVGSTDTSTKKTTTSSTGSSLSVGGKQ